MNEYYKILIEFSQGTTPCRSHLIRRHGIDLLTKCIQNNYIIKIGENSNGDAIYSITNIGKQKRDN